MEPEQCHIIECLHVRGLKPDEIATELTSPYGRDGHTPSSIKYLLR
jgi:hypothetical protein